jgi:glutamate synthase (NADPH) large chain
MSGGIAYLLDLAATRVNPEMVTLEELDQSDVEWLREVLPRYQAETGSTVAAEILEKEHFSRFTKVMPIDYKRVLQAQARAEAEGRDVLEAIMEASRG